jgi:hypothetical protein
MSRHVALIFILLTIFVISPPVLAAANVAAKPQPDDQSAILEAASWIRHADHIEAEYDYVMTCRLRLLLFWMGREDVGGGYVRIGKVAGQEPQQIIQVLFGSDPAKVPLSINRWGAGTEVLRMSDSGEPAASAFFGFMKSSKGQSVLAMKSELAKEKANGDHLFEGIISRVDDRALSTTVPYVSNRDFDLHQYEEAEKAALQQLESNPSRHIRRLDGVTRQACPRMGEFLSTTFQLMNDAVAGRSTPESLCYIYNARHYTATLASAHPISEKKVHVTLHGSGAALDQTYHHLQQAHFDITCEETGGKSSFDILLGTEGPLRGTPIQITYDPNWWFQVVLNLAPESPDVKGQPPGHPGLTLR